MVAAVASEPGSWAAALKPEYRRAILFCVIMTSGPILYGYDGTYFTSLLAETAFSTSSLVLSPKWLY